MDPHLPIAVGLGMPNGFEWVVIMVIGLLLFGKNLPSVMRGLGGSVKEFKKGMDEGAPPAAAPPALPPAAAPDGTVSRTPGAQPVAPPAPAAPQPPETPPRAH